MFRLLRTAPRVLSLTTSPALSSVAKSRSLTTITFSPLRQAKLSWTPQFQRRFASDDVKNDDLESHTREETAAEEAALDATVEAAANPEAESQYALDADAERTTVPGSEHDNAAVEAATRSAASAAHAAPAAGNDGNDGAFAGARRPLTTRGPSTPSNQLYVGNLFFDVTEDDLKREFSKFGNVDKVNIIYDGRGLSKGFGYVTLESVECAAAAIAEMNLQVYEGRRMTVQYTNKKAGGGRFDRERNDKFTQRELAPPSKTLFIGNMAFEMTDQDLNNLFKDIKNVVDVRVAIDRRTGQPRGFAHADFIDVESAKQGLKVLAGKEVFGRGLRVDYSTSYASRPEMPEN